MGDMGYGVPVNGSDENTAPTQMTVNRAALPDVSEQLSTLLPYDDAENISPEPELSADMDEAGSPSDYQPRTPTSHPTFDTLRHPIPRFGDMPEYRSPPTNTTYEWMSPDAVTAARIRARDEHHRRHSGNEPDEASQPDFDFDFSDPLSDVDTIILSEGVPLSHRHPDIVNDMTDQNMDEPHEEGELLPRKDSVERYDPTRAEIIAVDREGMYAFMPPKGAPDPPRLAVAVRKSILEQEEEVDEVGGPREGLTVSAASAAATHGLVSMPYFAQRVFGSPDLPFVAVLHPDHPIYSHQTVSAGDGSSRPPQIDPKNPRVMTIYESTTITRESDQYSAIYGVKPQSETNTALYDLGRIIQERLELGSMDRGPLQRYLQLKARQAALSEGSNTAALQVVPTALSNEQLMLQSLGIFDLPKSASRAEDLDPDFETQLIMTDRGRDALPDEFGIVVLGDIECPYSAVTVSRGAQPEGLSTVDNRKYREVNLRRRARCPTTLPRCMPY